MIKEALSKFPHINLSLVALMIFVSIFVVMLFWIYRKDSKAVYDKASNLPLEG